jgi:hypothetical protein
MLAIHFNKHLITAGKASYEARGDLFDSLRKLRGLLVYSDLFSLSKLLITL